MSAQAQDRDVAPPPLSIEELTRGMWPFRKSLGRIALEIAVTHNADCVERRKDDKKEHADTRDAIVAVRAAVDALAAKLKPLTEAEADLQRVRRIYRGSRVAWWGVAKLFGMVMAMVMGVAGMAEAWPMIRWTLSAIAGALLRHLSGA